MGIHSLQRRNRRILLLTGLYQIELLVLDNIIWKYLSVSLVGWGCWIYWLHLWRGLTPLPNECSGYDIKQSDGETLALGIWETWSTLPLLLFPGPLWHSKVIKSFVPELRSCYMFFVFRDSYVLRMYVTNILCTFHIFVFMYGYGTNIKSSWLFHAKRLQNHIHCTFIFVFLYHYFSWVFFPTVMTWSLSISFK